MKKSSAFTLVELLTVMALIVILAGLTVGVSGYVGRKSMETKIRAQITMLENALEAYKTENGMYPRDLNSSSALSTQFTGSPTNTTSAGWSYCSNLWWALSGTNGTKSYMSWPSKQIKTVSSVVYITDPLGNLIGYNPVDPVANPQTFDVFSCGVAGTNDYPGGINSSASVSIGNWRNQ